MRKVAAGVVLGLVSSLALAAPGEYWEMTNKMEVQGMSMPGMTNKVCMPKGGEKDPRNSSDKDCEVSEVKNSGNRVSWKMRCNKNGDVMTATGDMTSSPDRNEGTISISSAKTGNMSMSFVNKRLGGACDSDEMKKRVEGQIAASNREMAKICEGMRTPVEWYNNSVIFLSKGAPCIDKKDKFCEVMRQESGHDMDLYFGLKRNMGDIGRECGVSVESAKKALCKGVDINNADFNRQMRKGDFSQQIRAECPAEMKAYADAVRKRNCERQVYTENPRQELANCLKGGSGDEAMRVPDPDEPPMPSGSKKSGAKSSRVEPSQDDSGNSAPKQQGGIAIPGLPNGTTVSPDALIDGAKKLKNLFGF